MNTPSPRRLILLGSTGSIGVQTLDCLAHLGDAYQVVGLAAGSRAEQIIEQARQFGVTNLALADEKAAEQVQAALPEARVFAGADAARQMTKTVDAEMLITAVVGAAGLPATLVGIERGMTIGLANKETLVAAGELVMPLARKHDIPLLPIDSEHSAIFQCLQGSEHGHVKRIVLTASGGPFRDATKQEIEAATVDEALNHPTWNMGPKITIDSATMMNKALEIIEAHWLFDLSAEQIDVIIHPQSIAHSFVEFDDHSILAQMGTPDMRTPIQYALTYPGRVDGCSKPLDWTAMTKLDFAQPDHDRFPSLGLAYRAIRSGGTAGAVLNAANEAAVAAFLGRRIRFVQIVQLVEQAMDAIAPAPVTSLDAVQEADRAARHFVAEQLA
jgi:1-deoxy-D-xylulose-5-phosphate reductoisomerase